MSACSSILFVVGFPAPWPAFVSTLRRIGFLPAAFDWRVATNFLECMGTTLSSVSAEVTRMGGYFAPGLTLCSGE